MEEHPPPAEEERQPGPQASEPPHAMTHLEKLDKHSVEENIKYFEKLRGLYLEKLNEHSPAHGAVEERIKYFEKLRG
eukprot:5795530-Heterocapsa_arctica.AAC.1